MLLNPEQRTKLDPSSDQDFYSFPRFVTHVDQGFIDQLTDLYREQLKPHSRVLDLMSSWVSHLPDKIELSHVEGHGLNAEELSKNPRLNHYFTQDLNQNPKLPLPDQDFDAVLMAVSVQYLQYPEAVFSEICRILKPQGKVIISFSNRMFYQKAIAIWRDGTDLSRTMLVKRYLESVSGFNEPQTIMKSSKMPDFLQMLGVETADPFHAVIAEKKAL